MPRHRADDNKVLGNLILLPDGADERLRDRATLHNEIEITHTAKNSQLARWARVNIPREIPEAQRMDMVASFVQKEFVSRGMVADIALQEIAAGDGLPNPHAHILLAMRPLEADGKSFPKRAAPGRPWNDLFTRGVKEAANDNKLGFSNGKGEGDGFVRNKEGLVEFREKWANHVNEWLEANGSNARCSHETYEARGIEKEAQPYIGRAKYGEGITRENSKAITAAKAVKIQNRLARASRYNHSGDALAEAEQIQRAEAARNRNQERAGGGRGWSLAEDWGVDHER